MGESVASHGALEVSISFGRFENDSLSWEKWSSFSPNKYLEEVEKCSTPGYVAQKKAYFEAHYKKIAARKAKLLEQDNAMGADCSRSDGTNWTEHVVHTSENDPELNISDDQNSTKAVTNKLVDDPAEDDSYASGYHDLIFESYENEINGISQSNEVIYSNEADLVSEGIPSRPLQGKKTKERPLKADTETIVTQESRPLGGKNTKERPLQAGTEMIVTQKNKEENFELALHEASQKVSQIKKELNVSRVTKNKLLSPTSKSSEMSTHRIPRSNPSSVSTPRMSKPLSTPTPRMSKQISTSTPRIPKLKSTTTPRPFKPISTSTTGVSKQKPVSTKRLPNPISTPTVKYVSQSSIKKPGVSSSQVNKNSYSAKIKTKPTSHDTSLTRGPTYPDSSSLIATKKSSIMERMGDKDIVKRAFKTFQNNLNQSRPTHERPHGPKQISVQGLDHEVSTSTTSQKENERRTRKSTEKMSAQTQPGARLSASSSRSLKEPGAGKNVKVVSSAVGLRHSERSGKHKEIDYKTEKKSQGREVEKMGLSSTSRRVA